jgi:phosphoribosyl-ATP pyrophosphohydrolase
MAMPDSSVFSQLMAVIEDRKANPPARSYTTSLFQGGVARIGGKIIEEANEVVDAGTESADTRQQHLVHEAADLIYHLFVLLGYCDIPLAQLEVELRRRFGLSGLDEKAARDRRDALDE